MSIGILVFGFMVLVILLWLGERVAFRNFLNRTLPGRAILKLMLLLLTPIALAGYFVFWGRSPVPTSIVAWSSLALMVLGWLVLLSNRTRFPFVHLCGAL
jgi:hypothetical protein